jgi:hypothetical protein
MPTASGCAALSVNSSTQVDGCNADTYAWSDSACRPRTAALVRNNASDALGGAGGYARLFTYQSGASTRTCRGTGSNGWNGFGYIVNHYSGTDANTKHLTGSYSIALAGKHHAIHQFKWRTDPGGPVDVTVHWLFATGRDHPLFSITFDSSPAGANGVRADIRAPYGDLAFDETKGNIDGVSWGDQYRFTTTGSGPLTSSSAWDYTAPNAVPFDYSWSSSADAEMGLVQSQTWARKVAGGDYGAGLLSNLWGTTGSNLLNDVPDWLWPFQLNQYELPFVANSHRLAWGSNYGAVGQTSYTAFGKTLSGYPYQSYAVYVVLGTHSGKAVLAQASAVETAQATALTASRGTVSTQGPGGVGRADSVPYSLAGFNPVYGAFEAHATANAATLRFQVASGKLVNPLLRLLDYSAAVPRVTLDGVPLTPEVHFFASVQAPSQTLWLTLNVALSGTSVLTIDP